MPPAAAGQPAAAALATAALVCDPATGLHTAQGPASVLPANDPAAQPARPEPVRRPVEPARGHTERPMAVAG